MSRKPKHVFRQEPDIFGNLVDLYWSTWNGHVLDPVEGHPDMAGLEHLVLKVLQDPYEVCQSTLDNAALAYISEPGIGPRPAGIRVLVGYDSTDYEKGSAYGTVNTAYPIDLVGYSNPRINLARPIYRKKK